MKTAAFLVAALTAVSAVSLGTASMALAQSATSTTAGMSDTDMRRLPIGSDARTRVDDEADRRSVERGMR